MATQAETLLEKLDQSPLTAQHWRVIIASVLGMGLEFFDFFLIAFVLSFVIGPWKLTYGQTALVLLASGVGAIFGPLFFGRAADRLGRRPMMIATVLIYSIATGFMYFTPERGWIFLTICRFIVGFGVGGFSSVDPPLLNEFVPARVRGTITGLAAAAPGGAVILSSFVAAFLSPIVGWRGLFLVGLIPALLTLLIRIWIPESPRWLMSQGRYRQAERTISWVLGNQKVFPESGSQAIPDTGKLAKEAPAEILKPVPKVGWRDVFKYRRSVLAGTATIFCYSTITQGFIMWGATLLVLLLNIAPKEGARLFMFAAIAGLFGRLFFTYFSDQIGRRRAGLISGIGAGILFIIAGNSYQVFFGAISLFWLLMIGIDFFIEPGMAVMTIYGVELFPKEVRASGLGTIMGLGNFGKVFGPIVMAIFAGSSNIITPKATISAITPTYMFFGLLAFVAGGTFLLGRYEPKGKSLEEIDALLAKT